ncbi:MAG: hypothetical protein U5R49_24215 [Deltaproteobacteria bacterium]|nr:hypothetical protein [Deltaproteobacteria bacterium]
MRYLNLFLLVLLMGVIPNPAWTGNVNDTGAPNSSDSANKFHAALQPIGSGSEADPYLIKSLDNLYWISENPDQWEKYYKQTADINACDTSTYDGGNGFIPIGNESTNFIGTYDGGGYTIDGLFIDRSSEEYVGLFGYASNARIGNLGMTNVDITGYEYVGGLGLAQK